jgi:hypothetical protein
MKTSPHDIEPGDKVTVYTEVGCFDGVVRYTPAATGDCWHVEEADSAGAPIRMHYVQNFHEIIKILQ